MRTSKPISASNLIDNNPATATHSGVLNHQCACQTALRDFAYSFKTKREAQLDADKFVYRLVSHSHILRDLPSIATSTSSATSIVNTGASAIIALCALEFSGARTKFARFQTALPLATTGQTYTPDPNFAPRRTIGRQFEHHR